VSLYSRSAWFTALVTALETLIPTPSSGEQCPKCKRSVGKGATLRFREFLDEYAPVDPHFQRSRVTLFYEFRSKLAHGAALSYFDRGDIAIALAGTPREEQQIYDEIVQLVKFVIVIWLASRPAVPPEKRGHGITCTSA
jgi:hypothetical protein